MVEIPGETAVVAELPSSSETPVATDVVELERGKLEGTAAMRFENGAVTVALAGDELYAVVVALTDAIAVALFASVAVALTNSVAIAVALAESVALALAKSVALALEYPKPPPLRSDITF